MSKVKQRSVLTGVRNVKTSKSRRAAASTKTSKVVPGRHASAAKKSGKTARKTSSKSVSRRAVEGTRKSAKRVTITVVPARGQRTGRMEPIARYAIRPLDPLRKCGPGTSVQFLYLVEESVEGRRTTHLVFFDRHGWYCEHGRTCPAVAPARKYNGHIARGA